MFISQIRSKLQPGRLAALDERPHSPFARSATRRTARPTRCTSVETAAADLVDIAHSASPRETWHVLQNSDVEGRGQVLVARPYSEAWPGVARRVRLRASPGQQTGSHGRRTCARGSHTGAA